MPEPVTIGQADLLRLFEELGAVRANQDHTHGAIQSVQVDVGKIRAMCENFATEEDLLAVKTDVAAIKADVAQAKETGKWQRDIISRSLAVIALMAGAAGAMPSEIREKVFRIFGL